MDGAAGIVVAIIGTASGLYIAIHEFRRRERRVTRKEITELTEEVEALRMLLLEQRRYVYRLVKVMIAAGLEPPQPPAPSFDPNEYED